MLSLLDNIHMLLLQLVTGLQCRLMCGSSDTPGCFVLQYPGLYKPILQKPAKTTDILRGRHLSPGKTMSE